MSAVPQPSWPWASGSPRHAQKESARGWQGSAAADDTSEPRENESQGAELGLAFYRKHTENTLRRYLYASMQVGRTPSILGNPVSRGWVSSRPVRTFEDALIFVLDVERCLDQLDPQQRLILSRIVLQDYTQSEVCVMLHKSPRTIGYKFGRALDQLTKKLLENDLLLLPD